MSKPYVFYVVLLSLVCQLSCKNAGKKDDEDETTAVESQTPVTIAFHATGDMSQFIELNATSTFRQNKIIKSPINGYIESIEIKIGDKVKAGAVLFIIKTKEARSLGNTINKLDSSFHFTGTIKVAASSAGVVSDITHQLGDYVQDGEQLAVISESN